jgi:hypothetical protein
VLEYSFVSLAIGVFSIDVPIGAISSHGTSTMTNGKILTFYTVTILNELYRSFPESSACLTIQDFAKTPARKNVSEPKFRITCHPTITLRHIALRADAI